LDFLGGKERIKMPHKIHHEMVLVVKQGDSEHWTITRHIMSQEEFLKQDSKCMQCDKWLIDEQNRWV
jgi:hypothetical protein